MGAFGGSSALLINLSCISQELALSNSCVKWEVGLDEQLLTDTRFIQTVHLQNFAKQIVGALWKGLLHGRHLDFVLLLWLSY